jgi:hypothetical protein
VISIFGCISGARAERRGNRFDSLDCGSTTPVEFSVGKAVAGIIGLIEDWGMHKETLRLEDVCVKCLHSPSTLHVPAT